MRSTKKEKVVETREWDLVRMPVSQEQLQVLLENGHVPTCPIMMVRDKTPKEKLDPQMPPGPKVIEHVVPFFRIQYRTEAEAGEIQAEEEALKASAARLH